ncbi:MAG: CPBP family intramembrane glutamic endopeptidase [Arenimonas sp.]
MSVTSGIDVNKALRGPVLGTVIAIVINAAMDATGLSGLSFASLLPLMLIFWAMQGLSRKGIGLAFGRLQYYGLALLHPILIIGAIATICFAAGVADVSKVNWLSARNDFLFTVAISIPLAILTEEGFFRGWLYGSLQRAGMSELKIMIWTGVAFSLWHIPAVSMNTEDALPLAQIPVLLLNAVFVGAIWGMLRSISGSIIVTSVCHAVWNACVYVLFGFGTTVGVLGVKQTAIYGPESGLLGLGLNLVLTLLLWQWWKKREIKKLHDRDLGAIQAAMQQA